MLLSDQTLRRTNGNLVYFRRTPTPNTAEGIAASTYTVGANTKFIMLTMCSGGGGGGGARENNYVGNDLNIAGSGGSAGAHIIDLVLRVVPGQVFTCIVGAGGSGGVGTYLVSPPGTGHGTPGESSRFFSDGSPGTAFEIGCTGGGEGRAWDPDDPDDSDAGRGLSRAPGKPYYYLTENEDSIFLNSYGWVSDAGQEKFDKTTPATAAFRYGKYIRWGGEGGSKIAPGSISVGSQLPTNAGHTYYTDTDGVSKLRFFGWNSNPLTDISGGSGGSSFFGFGARGRESGIPSSAANYGAGGAGAGCAATSDDVTARTGGAGALGFIKVHEFYNDDPLTLFTSSNWGQFVNENILPFGG